jgi:HlyD family secretion protein
MKIVNIKMKSVLVIFASLAILTACSKDEKTADGYGNFEAKEIIVSAEAQGKLLSFKAERGIELKAGDLVAIIDTTQLILKKEQLFAQKGAIANQHNSIVAQTDVQDKQKSILLTEKARVERLLKDGAATSKQLDDIEGQLRVIESSIESIKSQNPAVFSNVDALNKQIEQLNDQINKCYVRNPIDGYVLDNFVELTELIFPGKTLYKIADLNNMELRIYISGEQLSQIKIGQNVKVLIDKNADENYTLQGTVTWISQKAEFTPKIIQTKKDRVNLVYAVIISVKNDGKIKIGMPAEVVF